MKNKDKNTSKNVQKRKVQIIRSKKKSLGTKLFWGIYAAFTVVAVIAIVVVLIVLRNFLIAFEDAQPEHKMSEIAKIFENADASTILDNTLDEYDREDYLIIADSIKDDIEGKEITYMKKYGNYKDDETAYTVYADSKEVATVMLKAKEERAKFDQKIWELDSISGVVHKVEDVVITAPSGYKVIVNGKELNKAYIVSTDDMDGYDKFEQFVTNWPVINTYKVGHLYSKPQIECKGIDGTTDVSPAVAKYPEYKFEIESSSEISKDWQNKLKTFVDNYVRYVLNVGSFSSISNMLAPNTATYKRLAGVAEISIYTGKHDKLVISDIEYSDYVMYSEDAFKVTLNFTYTISLYTYTRDLPTKLELYFAKVGNEYKIIDLNIS